MVFIILPTKSESFTNSHVLQNESKLSYNFIDLLVTTAIGKGFFSIWFQVFHDIATVKAALINELSDFVTLWIFEDAATARLIERLL